MGRREYYFIKNLGNRGSLPEWRYKVLIKKGNVVGVSEVKGNLVVEGVRLVKNLNVGGNIRKIMPTCSKMLMSSSCKCWTGSMTKRGKQVWQSKDMVWGLLL
ncbi:hypothetical protein KY284_015205 [Solanum tuberosum]|nr:hypothetical protein KY284_015205 [Solanum tuberosum]